MIPARKISFREAWNSSVVFFVDAELEQEIETRVDELIETERTQKARRTDANDLATFLVQHRNALDVVLKDLELSIEKFMRIVSLLRKIERLPGGFDKEWGIRKIKGKMQDDPDFVRLIAELLLDGVRDKELEKFIPRYYLELLDYRNVQSVSEKSLRNRYKRMLIGTYGARKGHWVEAKIREELEEIQSKHGISFEKGRSRIVETDIDFAIPSVEDPWVIIMSSFQETTSSGQTTKARDMLSAYERVRRINSRYGENRAFVNFVDGGGWLARRRDLERLVDNSHYFINLNYMEMLEAIILKHTPKKHFKRA